MISDELIHFLHTYSVNNFDMVSNTGYALCFFCLDDIPLDEINEFVDCTTCICPRCGIDSLLPKVVSYSSGGLVLKLEITKSTATEMRDYYFSY
jgi:hypothetical protein